MPFLTLRSAASLSLCTLKLLFLSCFKIDFVVTNHQTIYPNLSFENWAFQSDVLPSPQALQHLLRLPCPPSAVAVGDDDRGLVGPGEPVPGGEIGGAQRGEARLEIVPCFKMHLWFTRLSTRKM